MEKNHGERTEYKQYELSSIIASYIEVKNSSGFTYCDLNGGCGGYEYKGMHIPGSGVTCHNTLKAVRKNLPGLQANGYIFENNSKAWPLLNQRMQTDCPDHSFKLYYKDSMRGGRVYQSEKGWQHDSRQPPLHFIKEPLADGMFYFDPHGDVLPAVVKQYADFKSNYMVLCNLQRKTIIRQLWKASKTPSPIRITSTVQREWLISPPVNYIGWCWLIGVDSEATALKLASLANYKQGKEFLFPLRSEPGQVCFKLITKSGHRVYDYFAKKTYKYRGTLQHTSGEAAKI